MPDVLCYVCVPNIDEFASYLCLLSLLMHTLRSILTTFKSSGGDVS